MTKLHNLSTLIALFLASSTVFAEPRLASEVLGPTPPELQVHISPDEIAYVLNCGKKLIHDCGRKIFASVFREVDLNDVCCPNLVCLGKRCLDTTIKGLLSMLMFHKYSTKVLPRSEAVWNHCTLIA
ncbi:hypothetical protein L1049_020648 [Liquidambar formosana]|uniref:Prolamin-like domain-containing protein n=1 Tax=Liquidambar formosana TaxID=63359 RepID=A0AAP0SDD9_LIQFO